MRTRNIIRIAVITALLLFVPLVAMQFTDEVNWTPLDFAVAGCLIFGAGLAYELGIKRMGDKNRRRIATGLLALVFLYVWAELAVGIFTNLGS